MRLRAGALSSRLPQSRCPLCHYQPGAPFQPSARHHILWTLNGILGQASMYAYSKKYKCAEADNRFNIQSSEPYERAHWT
ncbi:hypothetical protein KM043_006928 [Ampulex compressa]|nr:hypothetical protein KM043_006928 [Ampulex compressa]